MHIGRFRSKAKNTLFMSIASYSKTKAPSFRKGSFKSKYLILIELDGFLVHPYKVDSA